MNIRFYNAKILTMKEPIEIIEGQLFVKDERIIFVGSDQEFKAFINQNLEEFVWDREIDCKGNLLMPGFKNAHTHSPMVLFRSLADDMELDKWLNEQIFPIEAKLTGEECYELTKLAVMEYLTSGVTSVFDMYFAADSTLQSLVDCGMRCVEVSGLNDFALSLETMDELYQKWKQKSNLASFMLGVHAEYTCSLDLLKDVAKLVQKYKAPFYAHMCETQKEVDACIEKYGKTPYELFDELGLFDYGGGGYHGIYVSDKDIQIMKEKNLSVVTCPASNLKLASGIAPISRYLDEQINVAIGTDGAGSNNCLDIFREMFLVTGLAKYRDRDAKSVDAIEVLKMATCNGAKAMGLDDCDTLEVGKYADIILLELNQPNMQPLNNVLKNIVYSGSKQNVKMTMINGKILYENGQLYLPFDSKEIYRKANAIANRMK